MPTRFHSLLLSFVLATVVVGSMSAPAFAFPPDHAERMRGSGQERRAGPGTTLGERAARIALRAVGVPYRFGGESPTSGFDCSGLVRWAYWRLGVDLPHSSYSLSDVGRRVPVSSLAAGDILLFEGLGHVGLYAGRGRMVHAPGSGRNVEVVRLAPARHGARLIGARRVIST